MALKPNLRWIGLTKAKGGVGGAVSGAEVHFHLQPVWVYHICLLSEASRQSPDALNTHALSQNGAG